jgi:Zn-dependent protease with chaperone function
MQSSGGSRTTACPQCGATLPVAPHYVTWCESCDWNVEPRGGRAADERPRDRRRRQRALNRAGALHEEMRRDGVAERGVDAGRILTHVLAILVLAIPLAMFAAGLWLLVASDFSVVGAVLAVVLTGAAVTARPRFGLLDKRAAKVERTAAPVLYAVLDRVAGALGSRAPASIVVEGSFNAATRFVGLRRRLELRIGVPLWAMLDDQQRVAVLSHELAHQVNGDTAHGLIVGGAMSTLVELQLLFAPSRVLHDESLGSALSELVRGSVAGLLRSIRLGMEVLMARPHQRAEYRADAAAARVAGSDAMIGALRTLLLTESSNFALQRARNRGSDEDPMTVLANHVQSLPERERERLRRVAAQRGSRVDDTHPPTPLRIEWVRGLPPGEPAVRMTAIESNAATEELRAAWRGPG